MKWLVFSPKPVWWDHGKLSDRTVVEADNVQVADGCLVFTDQTPGLHGDTITPVLLLSPSLWSVCILWKEKAEDRYGHTTAT